MTMPDNKPMTNEEYRDAVAKRLGWHTRPGGGWSGLSYIDANGEQVSTELDFQPDNDWASAGVWLEWLLQHRVRVCFHQTGYDFYTGNVADVTTVTLDTGKHLFGASGDTTPLALKAASERFLERSKT